MLLLFSATPDTILESSNARAIAERFYPNSNWEGHYKACLKNDIQEMLDKQKDPELQKSILMQIVHRRTPSNNSLLYIWPSPLYYCEIDEANMRQIVGQSFLHYEMCW